MKKQKKHQKNRREKRIPAAKEFSTLLRSSRRMTNERASRRNVCGIREDGERRRQQSRKFLREGCNLIYAQGGGVTSVINASACGVIESAKKNRLIDNVFIAKDGMIGVLNEELIDVSQFSSKEIKSLLHTPAGAFGSSRYAIKNFKENFEECNRIIDVFRAHHVGYFLHNGGDGSQDTTHKISQLTRQSGYPVNCIGIPKTIDNDLFFTDNSPGFGSVAKYVAVSIREASFDVASMAKTSTKVFILEVMGRHAGWIAASSGLAHIKASDGPHLILFPEIPFNEEVFLSRIKACVKKFGYAVIVASEGIRYENGEFLSVRGAVDPCGNRQLGGVAPVLANHISVLGYKYHWAVADYLQRAARHIASAVDVEQAYALGKAAVEAAVSGKDDIMMTLVRRKTKKYSWTIGEAPLESIANMEKKLPRSFITKDGFGITKKCRDYLLPLIQGEAYPPYKNGLPDYVQLEYKLVKKKLGPFNSR